MAWYPALLSSTSVPWRVRKGLERWVESTAYDSHPALYRWLHFGQPQDPTRAVTSEPRHHFFGYYDKTPWNASGRYLLAHESAFNDRAPREADCVGIGVVDLTAGGGFKRVTDGHAWNWQQGAMLQWHPAQPEHLFVHNDCRNGRFVGIVRDVAQGEVAVFDRPIYAILPDGRTAFSVDFSRLAVHRPGYGYAGGRDPCADDPRPAADGIWRIDLQTGRSDLMLSLAELAALDPKPSMDGAWHYVNHIQPSRGGARIAFFHVWHKDAKHWEVRLYTCKPDGSDLTCLLDTGFVSHYDWRDDDTILVWANRPSEPPRFLMISHERKTCRVSAPAFEVFGGAELREDGHCTFSPDGHWVLNDTYPDAYDKRTLMLVRTADARRQDIARLRSPKAQWWGEIRCDLHPRWSRDGKQVCIDSVHDGSRQIYVIDVSRWVA